MIKSGTNSVWYNNCYNKKKKYTAYVSQIVSYVGTEHAQNTKPRKRHSDACALQSPVFNQVHSIVGVVAEAS